jgi:hypothetical protein
MNTYKLNYWHSTSKNYMSTECYAQCGGCKNPLDKRLWIWFINDNWLVPTEYLEMSIEEYKNLITEDQVDRLLKLYRFIGVPENLLDIWLAEINHMLSKTKLEKETIVLQYSGY